MPLVAVAVFASGITFALLFPVAMLATRSADALTRPPVQPTSSTFSPHAHVHRARLRRTRKRPRE